MDLIEIRNSKFYTPSNWSEINKRNLLFLAKYFPYPKTVAFSLHFFFHCMQLWKKPLLQLIIALNFILSKKMNRAWKDDEIMEFGEENYFEQNILLALSQLNDFEWLHKNITFEKCLIDKFSVKFNTFYGPREYLANVSADEFRHAEFFFIKFHKTADISYLHRLIATLWRRKSTIKNQDDVRAPFSEFEVEENVKIISKLSRKYQYACLLCYTGMRNYFVNTENAKFVFDSDGDSVHDVLTNWGLILLRLAENSTFGTISQVKSAYIDDIILHLSDLKKRAEKEKYDRQNNQ